MMICKELGRKTYILSNENACCGLIVGAERALVIDPFESDGLREYVENNCGTEMPVFCLFTGRENRAAEQFDESYDASALYDGEHFHLGGVHVGLSARDRGFAVTVTREGVETFHFEPGFGQDIPFDEVPTPFIIESGVLTGFDRTQHQTRIFIPEGVTEIADRVFEFDLELSWVHFPSTLRKIGFHSFYGCRNLREARLPEGFEELSVGSFGICGLEEIFIPPQIRTIPKECFDGCMGYRELHIPGTVKEIGELAFSANHGCRRAILDEGVEKLGRRALSGIPELTDMELPSTIREIAPYAFDGSNAPRRTVLSGDVKRVEHDAFAGCHGLEEIIISDGIEELGDRAFAYCNRLDSVFIPKSVTKVGRRAFSGCTQLKKITVPRELSLPDDCFVNSQNVIIEQI